MLEYWDNTQSKFHHNIKPQTQDLKSEVLKDLNHIESKFHQDTIKIDTKSKKE